MTILVAQRTTLSVQKSSLWRRPAERTFTTSLRAVGKDLLDSSKHGMLTKGSTIFWRVKLSSSFQMQKYHVGDFCPDKNYYYVWM